MKFLRNMHARTNCDPATSEMSFFFHVKEVGCQIKLRTLAHTFLAMARAQPWAELHRQRNMEACDSRKYASSAFSSNHRALERKRSNILQIACFPLQAHYTFLWSFGSTGEFYLKIYYSKLNESIY